MMKILSLSGLRKGDAEMVKGVLLFVILLLMYPIVQRLILNMDAASGYVDPNMVLLLMISVICFLVLLGLCWWLFNRFLMVFSLPGVGSMVSRFKDLELCQQFGFYFASFALLLFAAVVCLVAVL